METIMSAGNSSKDIVAWMSRLVKGETLSESEIGLLCEKAKEILSSEENVVKVRAPVTICGDIHGQFHDLMELFRVAGTPPEVSFLFLGDYVDRGMFGVESLCMLLALKVRFSDRVTLLRGNHESRSTTVTYGFYDECFRKFGNHEIWRGFTELFDLLPLAAEVDGQLLCLHGGLSPDALQIDSLRQLDRRCEIPHDGPVCDVLWSDPHDSPGWGPSPRGAGSLFGKDKSEEFLRLNGLKMLVRAHQLVSEGYQPTHDGLVVTVFSAPNYCYTCNNSAAFLEVDERLELNYVQFEQTARRGDPEQNQQTLDLSFLN